MNKKLYIGLAALVILILSATVWVVLHDRAEIRQLKKELSVTQKMSADRDKPTQQTGQQELDPSHPDFHVHEDGTPHIGTHDEPKEQYTAPKGAATKPDYPKVNPNDDLVKAAYKRLEYIKNNPYAWGGVHSERATELIAQLLPASYAIDHNEGDERELLIYELCQQGDPRAAEALIAIMCDGGAGGTFMYDALEEIGPPAVPYILPYLEREDTSGSDPTYIVLSVFKSLTRIGTRYHDDLGGIVDHIIIPKFKEIAADEDNERYERATVIHAREALDRLQK